MDATLDLSVVVVTWNCRELALECIRTITTLTAGVSCEILVIDNASADGTPDAVAASFPAVRVIRNACNSGFAAANNVAFSQARGRYWLLLNPDAFPTGTYVVTRLLAAGLGGGLGHPIIWTLAPFAPGLDYAGGRIGQAYYLSEWLDCDCHEGSQERADADRLPWRITRLGRRHASEPVIRQQSPRGDTMYWIGPAGDAREAGEGSDFHATAEGLVSITPLQVDLTDHAGLVRWRGWHGQLPSARP